MKSILIEGNLKDNISMQLLPNEFSQGIWNICLSSIIYSVQSVDVRRIFSSVSCNLVTSQKYSKRVNQLVNYELPLAIFVFESTKKVRHINFDKTWFQINTFSSKVILTFEDLEKHIDINYDCDVKVLIFYQRIQ